MVLEFCENDGNTVVLNPRIIKKGNRFSMELTEKNCDLFLVIAKVPGGKVDLKDPEIQDALQRNARVFPDVTDLNILENIYVSCIKWSNYRINDYALDLSSRIAEYTVFACKELENENKIQIFVQDEDAACSAYVSLTVNYRLTKVSTEEKKKFFGSSRPAQIYYKIEFDEIQDYQDGSIVYTFNDSSLKYPVTGEMIKAGKAFIESGRGEPVFLSNASGLELKRL